MDMYTSEKEQVELIRDWFKKYGVSIILGIIIACILSFGWRFWQQHEITMGQQASSLYEQLLLTQSAQQNTQSTQLADALMNDYARTPYAGLAGLVIANNAVQQGNLDLAVQKLQWVDSHASSKSIQQIARIREARVLLAQNKPQQALQLLATVSDSAYIAEIDAVRGDVYVTLGKTAEAQKAYQAALNALPDGAVLRSFVQMKLANLG
jgi:predicted negative regulator of RcsB-dependent stress response